MNSDRSHFWPSHMTLLHCSATVFSYMRKFRTTIPNLACAVQLVKLLITIAGKDDDEDDVYREKIGNKHNNEAVCAQSCGYHYY